MTSAVSFSVSCPVAEVNTTAVDFIPSTTGFRSKTEPSIFSAKPLSGQSYNRLTQASPLITLQLYSQVHRLHLNTSKGDDATAVARVLSVSSSRYSLFEIWYSVDGIYKEEVCNCSDLIFTLVVLCTKPRNPYDISQSCVCLCTCSITNDLFCDCIVCVLPVLKSSAALMGTLPQ